MKVVADIENESPLDWGTCRELTPLEAIMWRADSDPMMRSTVMAIEILDIEPDWTRIVAAHEWASRMVPRLRDRVVEPLGFLGTPVWARDRHLDLHYHLRRVRVGGDGSWAELFSIAEKYAMTPFDRARPPWEAVLVEGLPNGKAAYLLKLHHSLTDGLGLTQLLSQIHSRQRAPWTDKPQPIEPKISDAGQAEHLVRQLRYDLGVVSDIVRETSATLLRGLRTPLGFASDTARYVGSARRVLSPPAARGLPALAKRGGSWRFVALEVDFADLRTAAKLVSGSLNDAFLAALLGAFRLYHEELGVPLAVDTTMPVSVPVSIRREEDSAGGNRFAPARLAAPVGVADPAIRMELIGKLVSAARGEPALESAEFVTPVLARMPASLLVRLAGTATTGNDLQASNVPGVSDDMYLGGAKIERIYPFAPLPGCAAMISLHTYAGVCCIGANLDAAAIVDPELYGRCLQRGFAEVLDLHSGATQPRLLT